MLIIIAIIHLLPIAGFSGSNLLESLYGTSIESTDLVLLMRHRAVLFGILGCVFAYSAFVPKYQNLAFLMIAASLLPFLFLVYGADSVSEEIYRVALVDVLALVCLLVAVLLKFFLKSKLKSIE